MSVAVRVKVLHFVGSSLILLFSLQLAAAVLSEFSSSRSGIALYPVFLGREPIALPNILLNFSMLMIALAAFYYADTLEGESFFKEHFAPRRRKREGTVHFSQ